MPKQARLQVLVARGLFCLIGAVGITVAFMPEQPMPAVLSCDKADHFALFYAMAFLLAFGAPSARLLPLALALSALGAFIELVQGLPFVARDSSVYDWVADSVGVACALAPIAFASRRSIRDAAPGTRTGQHRFGAGPG